MERLPLLEISDITRPRWPPSVIKSTFTDHRTKGFQFAEVPSLTKTLMEVFDNFGYILSYLLLSFSSGRGSFLLRFFSLDRPNVRLNVQNQQNLRQPCIEPESCA